MIVTGVQSGRRRISIHRSLTSSTIVVTSGMSSGSKVGTAAAAERLPRDRSRLRDRDVGKPALFGLFGELEDLELLLDAGDVILRELIREGVRAAIEEPRVEIAPVAGDFKIRVHSGKRAAP